MTLVVTVTQNANLMPWPIETKSGFTHEKNVIFHSYVSLPNIWKTMSSSVGIIIPNIWKTKIQTTNQLLVCWGLFRKEE